MPLTVTPKSQGQAQVMTGDKVQAQVKVKAQAVALTVPEAHPLFTPQGDKARCQVLVKSSGLQCQNPLNFRFRGHGTCHTHLNRLSGMTPQAYKAVRFTDKLQAYDKSLWGAPPQAQAQAQAQAHKVKASQVKVKAHKASQVIPEAVTASQAQAVTPEAVA